MILIMVMNLSKYEATYVLNSRQINDSDKKPKPIPIKNLSVPLTPKRRAPSNANKLLGPGV